MSPGFWSALCLQAALIKVISLQEISRVLDMGDTNGPFILLIIQEQSFYRVPTDKC